MIDQVAEDLVSNGAKLIVRILARRRRATGEPALRTIFEQEGGGTDGAFASAVSYALLHGWISRRPDCALTGPRMEGTRAAGLQVRYGRAVTR